jgi:hypothetical protein
VVGLKRLAPYREDAAKQRPNYKALQSLKGAEGGRACGSWGGWLGAIVASPTESG